jgi:DNA repair protein RecN (Recombination protein N)
MDRVEIEFDSGLNILTGETGAGKSIIIDSINAVLGERLSKEQIRSGKEKAAAEAMFLVNDDNLWEMLEKLGIEPEEDGTLIISREFSLNGKNNCRINGKMATVSMLKEIGEKLMDIHGQHDNQSLLHTEKHIELLDSFGGDRIHELKREYSNLLSYYKSLKGRLKSLTGDKNDRERKIDLLKFQIDEIKKAKLNAREEEELNKQRIRLSNSEKITETLSGVYETLFTGSQVQKSALDSIRQAARDLDSISRLDEKFGNISKEVEEISYQLEDAIEKIRRERDQTEYDPGLLEQIEERLDLIYKLKKKYGNTIEEVLNYLERIENELEEIEKNEETVRVLNEELNRTEEELYSKARELNRERRNCSVILEKSIGKELEDLEMKKAQFKVDISFEDGTEGGAERRYLPNGLDRVEFLISLNVGEPLKPLSKIASGGEMSRVMLAIKNILADVDKVPVLVFDEIDVGISGRAAQKVGEKLSSISKSHQVICVTHLAQIACMADNHYLIEKVSDEDSTRTRVKKLHGREIAEEIARILGGASISAITLKHAEEMLENARKK